MFLCSILTHDLHRRTDFKLCPMGVTYWKRARRKPLSSTVGGHSRRNTRVPCELQSKLEGSGSGIVCRQGRERKRERAGRGLPFFTHPSDPSERHAKAPLRRLSGPRETVSGPSHHRSQQGSATSYPTPCPSYQWRARSLKMYPEAPNGCA